MRGLKHIALVALAFLAVTGCQVAPVSDAPLAATAEAGTAFAVTLWDGTTLEGPVAWRPDGAVLVGGEAVEASQIAGITASEAAVEQVFDLASLPEGYGPLDDDALNEYRRRALEAAEKHEGVDSVFCLDKGEDALRADGTSVYRYHALHYVLKEAARSHASMTLGFSEGRSRARVLFARTIDGEGRSHWAPGDAFKIGVPPQGKQHFDKRRRVLSGEIPGAEVGGFIEYAYEYELHNPEMEDFFFPGYFFQSDVPVLDSVLDVLVPTGRPLNSTARNMEGPASRPTRFTRGGYDGYRWEMSDLPPLVAEPFMPPRGDVVPSVHTSLYFDWKKFMAPTGAFQRERTAVTEEVAELARQLTEGKTTDDEKVAAIYHWVQRNINYISIKASLSSGWAGHPSGETLKNGYGDCTDVANLVSSLCRAVGIDAYPAVVKTNDSGEAVTDIPMPDANHAVTVVYPDGRERFIDATSTDFRYPYLRADDHGIKAIVDMKEEILDIPVPAPENNMRTSVQEMRILADGSASVVERNAYTGPYEAGVRGYWRRVPPEMQGRVMQQYLQQRIPGALLTNFGLGDIDNLDEQLEMTIEYSIPVSGTRVKDLFIFALPGFRLRFPEISLAERKEDIVMPTTQAYETSVTVGIPEGFELAGVPDDLSLEGKHLSFEGSAQASDEGRSVLITMLYERLARRVPAAEYPEYRSNAAKIAAWTDLKVVLREIEGAAGEEVSQ
ncbi:MAG: DUF3857 domain-containing transglutaminase family protein [Planctomycetota bacterium]|jgi:transglutaminase-like putative cysteine protease